MFINTQQAAKNWGISDRRVRTLCAEGKIEGAHQEGRRWKIPRDAVKPLDGRQSSAEHFHKIIEEKKRVLDKSRPLTQGELERLSEEFAVEFTYNSNAIEGNTLTLRETDLVLRGLTIGQKPLKDHLEAVGHNEAFAFMRELAAEGAPLTEAAIRQIHYLVLADKREDRGVYRRIPVQILGSSFKPAQPYLIGPKMEQLLVDFAEDDAPITVRLARFHLEFEAIHPFIDGNGRTGRLLVNLELMKAGYPPIDIKFSDRLAYYKAFDEYHAKGRTNAMATLFARYLIQRLDQLLKMLR